MPYNGLTMHAMPALYAITENANEITAYCLK